ncbi:murein biosynthesis integral membrane protein MurJ [Clostridium sartagoforme]|uniref:murein biosynthesis integral membrane protein MurJ n=1 Tax=Clostridium sartagoforme TaxID=84031 RepID=UPI0012F7D2E4|nr:lipid II flippase MurJ [Clostridium sartagoforme]
MDIKKNFYMIKAMIPITIGLSVVQISQVVDKIIGSTLDVGSITSIELSNKIIMIIYGILSSCIITIFSPILSKKFLCEDKSEWIKVIQGLSKYMIILLVPISFGCIILSSDLVSVIYGRGNFSNNDINFVAMAFLGNVIQLPFLAIREIIGQGFYSTKNTIVPAINGGIAVIINIILTIIFSNLWGVFGITLGTSISTILGAILLLKSFKNKYDVFNLVDIIKCFTKVIISSLFMSLIVWIIRLTLVDVVGEFMVIVLSILIGGLSYFAFSLILKINEVKELTYYLLKNVRR